MANVHAIGTSTLASRKILAWIWKTIGKIFSFVSLQRELNLVVFSLGLGTQQSNQTFNFFKRRPSEKFFLIILKQYSHVDLFLLALLFYVYVLFYEYINKSNISK